MVLTLTGTSCRQILSDRMPEYFLYDGLFPPLYSVSGVVSGLAMEGLSLTTGGQSVEIDPLASDFVFPQRLRTDTAYDVIVTRYPQNASGMQYCTVVGGSGRIGNGDVSGIHVNCSDAATLSVNVQAGLKGTGLVLVNRGSDPLTINGEITDPTAFAFRTPVPEDDPVYDIRWAPSR